MTARKLDRVRKLSAWGGYSTTFRACLSHIPAQLRAKLTAAQIAAIIDGPCISCHRAGIAKGEAEARERFGSSTPGGAEQGRLRDS